MVTLVEDDPLSVFKMADSGMARNYIVDEITSVLSGEAINVITTHLDTLSIDDWANKFYQIFTNNGKPIPAIKEYYDKKLRNASEDDKMAILSSGV